MGAYLQEPWPTGHRYQTLTKFYSRAEKGRQSWACDPNYFKQRSGQVS